MKASHALVLHIFISTLYFVFLLVFRKKYFRQEAFARFIFILFLPFGGIIVLSLCDTIHILIKHTKLDMSDLLPDKSDHRFIQRPNMQQELNLVPVEEEIITGEKLQKRKYLLNLLKSNYRQYIRQLKVAVDDPDTETSHYAAVAMFELKAKITNALQSAECLYKEKPEDYEIAETYANALKEIINSNISDAHTQIEYMETLSTVLKESIDAQMQNEQVPLPEEFVELVNALVENKDYVNANQYNNIFMGFYANIEDPYLLAARIYYLAGEYSRFLAIIGILRMSKIPLSRKGLDFVRFWAGAK